MSKKWTEDHIRETLRILSTHHEYSQALEEIGETSNSLGGAFKRAGLESPTSYLAQDEAEATFRRMCSKPEGIRSIVVANDFHVPFHNVNGVKAWLQFCRDMQPDIIVINGDFLDCYSISAFQKAPGMPVLQDEIDAGLEILEQLRRYCPVAEIWFTEGNHEERLRRLIKTNHGLYNLKVFTLEALLEFERLGIRYKQYGDPIFFGDLAVYHGEHVSRHSGYSAKRELERGGFRYCVTGHVHRMGMHMQKTFTGNRMALENGGLFDVEQAEYLLNANWQNGFCIIYQNPDTEFIQMNPIYMQYDGSFIWHERMYGAN